LAEGNDKPTNGPRPDAGPADGVLPEHDPAGSFEGESMTRRKAFTVMAAGLGGAAGAVIVLPAVGFALAPVFDQEPELWEAVGSLDDFVPETYTPRVITIAEGIGEAGKTTVYVRQGNPGLHEQDPKLPEESPDEYIAISTRCAHLGCPVRFVQAAGNFICPCHGGVYNFEGQVIGGPPVRPLDRFQTRVSNGQVEIGPRYSVTGQLDPVRYRDPGEYTGGAWEYIYPPRPSVPPPP
jgi:Rieske Fe-S protein